MTCDGVRKMREAAADSVDVCHVCECRLIEMAAPYCEDRCSAETVDDDPPTVSDRIRALEPPPCDEYERGVRDGLLEGAQIARTYADHPSVPEDLSMGAASVEHNIHVRLRQLDGKVELMLQGPPCPNDPDAIRAAVIEEVLRRLPRKMAGGVKCPPDVGVVLDLIEARIRSLAPSDYVAVRREDLRSYLRIKDGLFPGWLPIRNRLRAALGDDDAAG